MNSEHNSEHNHEHFFHWPAIIFGLIITLAIGLGLAQVTPDSDEAMKHYNPQPDWKKLEGQK